MLELLEKRIGQAPPINSVGLSSHEAKTRLAHSGENRLAQKKRNSAAKIFAGQFHDVMVLILMAATVISVLLGEYADAIPILLIVIINAFLGFFQEYRCEKTLEKLQSMTAPSARCYRDGVLVKIPAAEVVTGDVIVLESGDRVPCDGYLMKARALSCDESVLTGEAVAADKRERADETDFGSLNNDYMCYMGTVVTKGTGVMKCVATGKQTQMGKVSRLLEEIDEEQTPLQKKLGELGKVLAVICLGVCVLVFLAGVLRGEPVLDMVMTGITIAIAAIPEGLPATVTIALALAVRRMLRRKALVHRLHSVETLGCATVICTDKTGTVTRNIMTVTDFAAVSDRIDKYKILDTKKESRIVGALDPKQESVETSDDPMIAKLMRCACLCSNATLKMPSLLSRRERKGSFERFAADGDPTEAALVTAAAKCGITAEGLGTERIDEIPFDSRARSMTVVCKAPDGSVFSLRKGSCDVILNDCVYKYSDSCERTEALTNPERLSIMKLCDDYSAQGLRVLAFEEIVDSKAVFLGLAAMKDPPRPEAKHAVSECAAAGIRTVMITGDHKLTAAAIAAETGIMRQGDLVLTGDELDRMSDGRLDELAEHCSVFARVTPEHKLRIVRSFKRKGHIVAMTGDGVNDAPAVKEADIGVSMGISGTEVTKQAAELILLDDNFATLVNAVEEGRTIYRNIRKFVRYLISCNIGEVLTMLGGIIMGLPMVLLPAQILLVNLVTDSLPAIALGLEPPEREFMTEPPRRAGDSFFSGGLLWRILIRGVLIGLSTLASFTVLLSMTGSLDIARTGALCTLVVSQLIHVFECKSEKKSLLSVPYHSNPFLLFSVAVSAFVLTAGMYLPMLQSVFCTRALTRNQLFISLGFSMIVPVLAGIFKRRKKRS